MNRKLKSILCPLGAAMLWGLAFAVQKYNTVGTFTFNAARDILAALFLFGLLMIRFKGDARQIFTEETPEKTRSLRRGGIAVGCVLAAAAYLQQKGLDMGNDAGKTSFLTAIYMLIVPVFSFFLGKKPEKHVWIAVFLAVAGMFLLCVKNGFRIEWQDLIVIFCAVLYAVHIMLIDHVTESCDAVKVSFFQVAVAFVVSVIGAAFTETFSAAALREAWLPVLYCGILSSGVGFTLQVIGQKISDPTVCTLLMSMESVFGALAGALFLRERMTYREYAGCLLILAAVIIAELRFDRKRRGMSKICGRKAAS